MVEFETLATEKIKFGRNNFIEVARKKATAENGQNEFISVSRGYTLPDGTDRFKKSLAIPDQADIKEFVSKKIVEL